MPSDVLVDTDVLIDHLRGAARLARPPGTALHYSVITRCELAAGSASQQPAVAKLLAAMTPIAVDEEIADAAGSIRRETGIATPDALIAASAIARGLELLSRNRRDFDRVEGLRLAPA